jgi:hypothetical protein
MSAAPIQDNRPLRPGSTYLLHLPGIAGDTAFDRWWIDALRDGDAADHTSLYDWTCHDPGIDALQAYERNRREAAKVAQLIRRQCESDPTGHVILTAESGGTGIVIFALEKLPPRMKVDQVLLIAPALSPGYDLSMALRHVNGKIYYFSSPGDWFTLGVGTNVFGTMDGKNTNSAGYVGFTCPKSADRNQYRKLVEMKYDPAWSKWGDFGGHTGGMSVSFARHFLAPLLLRGERFPEAVPANSNLPGTIVVRCPLTP